MSTVDVLIIMATFSAVLIGGNLDRMPNGLDTFLAMRVTVKNVLLIIGLIAGVLITFRAVGLYDAWRLRRWSDERRRIVLATTVVTGLATAVPLTSRSDSVDQVALLMFWLGTCALLLVARGIRAKLTRSSREPRRVIIVGTGPQAMRIYRELCADVLTPCRVIGFVDTRSTPSSPFLARRTLGTLDQLESLLVREHVDEVYLGLPVRSHYLQIQATIHTCESVGVKAMYRADIFSTELARPRVSTTDNELPRVQLQMAPEGVGVVVKRFLDIVGASVALVLLGPMLLAAAIAIRWTSPGPVLYSQERCGLNRRHFRMYKFRTMVPDADALQSSLEADNEASGPVFKITNDPRVTPVGRFLRRSSIDELPQLFNVLRGDMSLVGPRPLPLRDVARFTRTGDFRRFSVRPGVTCLWQVNGRSAIGFDDWVKLDLDYIDRWSLGLDMVILARTVPAVLRGTGAR